jgi:glycerophosphoryl diester phosphodiesterase
MVPAAPAALRSGRWQNRVMGRPRIYAHRGARAQERENTVAAFSLAIAQGADGVELDVRKSGDGALIVHHEDRAGPGAPFITEDLATIKAATPWVPTLDEAWLAIGDDALFNIEVKNVPGQADFDPSRVIAEDVVRWAEERGDTERILVSSFDDLALAVVRDRAPSLATGLLTAVGVPATDAIEAARRDGHVSVHLPELMVIGDAAAVVAAAGPLDVLVWTVNDPAAAMTLAEAGVTGIFTDDPALMVELFA